MRYLLTDSHFQLTKEKINQVSLLDPLPYEPPKEVPAEEIEVVDETNISDEANLISSKTEKKDKNDDDNDTPKNLDDKGQITLF